MVACPTLFFIFAISNLIKKLWKTLMYEVNQHFKTNSSSDNKKSDMLRTTTMAYSFRIGKEFNWKKSHGKNAEISLWFPQTHKLKKKNENHCYGMPNLEMLKNINFFERYSATENICNHLYVTFMLMPF